MWVVIKGCMAIVAADVAIALVFQKSPRRHQPHVSWLVVGSSIATGLWLCRRCCSLAFGDWGTTFGETYGPIAGIMALAGGRTDVIGVMVVFLAFAAQLEAVPLWSVAAAGREKVEESEPAATGRRLGSRLLRSRRPRRWCDRRVVPTGDWRGGHGGPPSGVRRASTGRAGGRCRRVEVLAADSAHIVAEQCVVEPDDVAGRRQHAVGGELERSG